MVARLVFVAKRFDHVVEQLIVFGLLLNAKLHRVTVRRVDLHCAVRSRHSFLARDGIAVAGADFFHLIKMSLLLRHCIPDGVHGRNVVGGHFVSGGLGRGGGVGRRRRIVAARERTDCNRAQRKKRQQRTQDSFRHGDLPGAQAGFERLRLLKDGAGCAAAQDYVSMLREPGGILALEDATNSAL